MRQLTAKKPSPRTVRGSHEMAILDGGAPGDKDAKSREPPADPITPPEGLWLLDERRLMCGDATSARDVARLRGGTNPHLAATTPYGFEYDPAWCNAADHMERRPRWPTPTPADRLGKTAIPLCPSRRPAEGTVQRQPLRWGWSHPWCRRQRGATGPAAAVAAACRGGLGKVTGLGDGGFSSQQKPCQQPRLANARRVAKVA